MMHYLLKKLKHSHILDPSLKDLTQWSQTAITNVMKTRAGARL